MYQPIIGLAIQRLAQGKRLCNFSCEPGLIDAAVQVIRDFTRENFRIGIDRKKPKRVLPMILKDRKTAGRNGRGATVGHQLIVIDPRKPMPQALRIGLRL